MNHETRKMARAFAACAKWRWLPGMQAVGTIEDVDGVRIFRLERPFPDGGHTTLWRRTGGRKPSLEHCRVHPGIPDLDDTVTRAALVEIVRAAWGMKHIGVWANPSLSPGLRFSCGEAGGRVFHAGTEIVALLEALQGAP